MATDTRMEHLSQAELMSWCNVVTQDYTGVNIDEEDVSFDGVAQLSEILGASPQVEACYSQQGFVYGSYFGGPTSTVWKSNKNILLC